MEKVINTRVPRRFCLLFAIAVIFLTTPLSVSAADGPRPPCAGDAIPAFPPLDVEPVVKTWFGGSPETLWTPPDCMGWGPAPYTILLATAARFRNPGGVKALVARLAAVSQFTEIQYWSTTRGVWRPLVTEATALSGPNPDTRRDDFDPEQLTEDKVFHFRQNEETPAGDVVYRINVVARDKAELVLEIRNARTETYLGFPLFAPGDYRTFYVFRQEREDIWQFYSISRVVAAIAPLVRQYKASYVNRAVAVFRYFAKIPTDKEPPAIR